MEETSGSACSVAQDDVALARLLQQQEQALYDLRRESDEAEGLSDEELARRLQEEEERVWGMAEGEEQLMLQQEGEGEGAEAATHGEPELTYEDMLALGDLAGKVSKGLAAEALDSLPVVRVCSLREHGRVLLDRCCVCLTDFDEEDEATPMPSCRHCFHPDCVKEWLQQSKACPVCGQEQTLGSSL